MFRTVVDVESQGVHGDDFNPITTLNYKFCRFEITDNNRFGSN